MGKYTIELKYNATIIEVVDAKDEGDALEKARIKAENADANEFTFKDEQESRILNTR